MSDQIVDFFSDTSEVNAMMLAVRGKHCFDVGANGGKLAAIFAEHFDEVLALEPAVESFRYLRDHAPDNVLCLQIAASDKTGEVTLLETSNALPLGELVTGWMEGPTWGEETGSRTVRCMSLDSLADCYGWPDFVKIDTEGHECFILRGAVEVFKRGPQFIIEVHTKENGDQCQTFLQELELPYRLIRHEAYRPGSRLWESHYWLVGDGN